jgi:hypothetical protein
MYVVELACGEKPRQILLNEIVITFTNKVNVINPKLAGFGHKNLFWWPFPFAYSCLKTD